MLVLTRKTNEAIKIGNDIEISIVAIQGDQVKIGISAPHHVEIYRKEVFAAIQRQNSEAANVPANVLSTLTQKNVKPKK